jgi:hypothetical protein
MGTVLASAPWTGRWSTPAAATIARNPATGDLWAIVESSPTVYTAYRSTNNGTSWASGGTQTLAAVTDIGEICFDSSGANIHWCYVEGVSGKDSTYYKRVALSGGTASFSATRVEVNWVITGGGTPGDAMPSCACIAYRLPSGAVLVLVASSYTYFSGSQLSGMLADCVLVQTSGTASLSGMTGARQWATNGDTNVTPSIDFEHSGDGIASSTPNAWITWLSKTVCYAVKVTWGGSSWAGPSSTTTIKSGTPSITDAPCRWDGSRLLVAVPNASNGNKMDIHERNKSNTSTTTRTTPSAIPAGTLSSYAVAPNSVTGDFRIFVQGNSPYYIDYFRASGTWGSWTIVPGLSGLVAGDAQRGWSVRRSTGNNYQYDYLQHDGSGTNIIRHVAMAINAPPTTPTWIYGAKYGPTANGQPMDVGQPLGLAWQHNDPKGDPQASYALSRQIGAAALQYWRASDSTWQAAEVQNVSASQTLTLTAAQWPGAGGAADATHTYKIKTWDGGGLNSGYSTGLTVVPSTHVDPALTAPTTGATITDPNVTATWTVAEQSAYRVQLLTPLAVDEFGRTAASGWGSADYGGAYTATGGSAADFSVGSGAGKHSHAAVNTSHQTRLAGISLADVDVTVLVTGGATVAGNLVEGTLRARHVDDSNYVAARVWLIVGGAVQLALHQFKAGVDTNAGSVTIPGLTGLGPHAVRLQVVGATARARVWNPTIREPDGWDQTLTVTHLDQGAVTCRSVLNTANTNTLPYVVSFDSLYATRAGTPLADSGWLTDPSPAAPSVLTYTPDLAMPDGQVALLTLQTKNVEGLTGQQRSALFTVDYIEPATPVTATITPDPTAGGIYVTVSQPAPSGGQPITARLDVWHRTVGDTGAGIRVAAGVTAGIPVLDWRTVSGVAYEWAPVAYGVNGTTKQGSWVS